jgi:hypothetical protein
VKFRSLARRACALILICLLSVVASVTSPGKSIRLRNETITPDAASGQATASATPVSEPPTSKLFLIQFTQPVQPAWREQLRALGVELLRYVPEDAFVAKFDGAAPGQIRKLEFVSWVGPYRPDHKLQGELRAARGQAEPLQVAVLLSPRATESDADETKRHFDSVRQESKLRSGRVMRGQLKPAQLDALEQSDAVLWIEPARDMKLFDEVASKIVAGDAGPNLLLTDALGYDGSGVSVAVADSGLNNGDAVTMHPDLLGRTPAFIHYGSLTDAADEHSHGTHVAGIIVGNGATGEVDDNGALYGLGVAPGASIVTQRLFDGIGNYEPPLGGFLELGRDAKQAGADIGSNSWGDDTGGRYDTSAMEFDELVRDGDWVTSGDQPYILEFSAGNAGPGAQTIGSPAVAKNVIATGASQNDRLDLYIYGTGPDTMADFSSRGPCEDGRIKPDIVAPGTWISSALSASATDENAWLPISENYIYMGGTSQAGPHASGAAAVFVQFYRETHTNATPSPALVKAALINSAVDMDNAVETGPVPNNDEGWGRIDLTGIIGADRDYEFHDQTAPLSTDQVWERRVVVGNDGEPLRITIAYTDVPGAPFVLPALVNDLDLEVVGPEGELYRGNAFLDGESVPGTPAADDVNNVECVYLSAASPGEYVVRVRARNVPEDARLDTPATDQDFALVISGKFPPAGSGVLAFDRAHYTAPSQVRVRLHDLDLASAPTATVLARSSIETNAESLLLHAFGATGTFTGTIATATGPALADGKLQIQHGGTITVSYFDASFGVTRTASAVADLVAPVLTNVRGTNEFGEVVITWHTDEPASSIVRYSTNTSLAFAVTNRELVLDHSVSLADLTPGRTWRYAVISTDEAGNTATNNNGGTLFSIVPQLPPTVLLVDEYQDPLFGAPPLSGYTDALNGAGVGFDVWDVGVRGTIPSVTNLLAYRAVVWRVGEFTGWSASDCQVVSNYLAAGGALFVASMDLLTRNVEAVGTNFNRNVLRVQSFIEDDTVPSVVGTGDPVGEGMNVGLDYTIYANLWLFVSDISDTFTPATNAAVVVTDGAGGIAGLRWPQTPTANGGRLVFFSFPLDAVPMGGGTNDRVQLVRNALRFLVPGAEGAGALAFDRTTYTLPSLVSLELGDSDLQGQASVNVTVSSSTQTNPVTVALQATPTPGVFQGGLSLVAATNAPATNHLRAANGDTLQARYFDASRNATVTVSAVVDTVSPYVTGVSAEPDFVQAVVFWDTDELCDALVQFGESPVLERTGYDAALDTAHAVTLTGLRPDTRYYYRVISRDAAGNQVIKDNNGQPYTLDTLVPLLPPFSDNMESGASNWSVFNSEDTLDGWALGAPHNGHETAAHSPTHAWGTSLNGGILDYSETFLISPTVYLTGGNTASLTFWQSYDFIPHDDLDIWEVGTIYIITNGVGAAIPVAEFGFDATNWNQVTVDLTPYVGSIVNVVFSYQLLSLSLDPAPRVGWLVDDVSIVMGSVQAGSVRVTNNLWQADFVLSGPAYRHAKGPSLVVSNAPPGTYFLEYAEVPYYQRPTSQTNTLTGGGSLLLQGNYTFADANANGIPDGYELVNFGTVTTNRTRFTDTDGDGLSDYAEFVAGTDPNNPPPPFRLTPRRLTNGLIQLAWPSVTNHTYRVHGSANMTGWSPFTDWLPADGTNTIFTLPAPTNGAPQFFRIEAALPGPPNAIAGLFRVTPQMLLNGQLRLEWPSAPGHGYRILGSADGTAWAPFSDWLRASGHTTGITLPPRTNGAPYLFRIEARP